MVRRFHAVGTYGYEARLFDIDAKDYPELPDDPVVVLASDYDKLITALVAVCERGDTDHSAKSMYWIASDALKAAGYDSNGRPTSGSDVK